MADTCLHRLSSALLLTALMPVLARPAAAGVDRWTPIGPEGGEIVSLAADPDAPGTLYAGTIRGGVWKSVDGGGSWTPTPEGLAPESISSLAVTSAGVLAAHYYSMYLLADGASTWRPVGPFSFSTTGFAVDPTNPARVWASGGPGGVLLSEDGGETWSQKLRLAGTFFGVAIAPTSPPTVYVTGSEGIFASTDRGRTWRQITPGLEGGPVFELAVDAEDPATLYASSPYSGGFWKSADAGAHWSFTSEVAPAHLLSLPGVLLGADSWLSRSMDRGETWTQVTLPWWGFFFLTADPTSPAAAWLGVQAGGLLHTADGGQTWARTGRRGLRATDVRAFAFDPFLPRTLYAATLGPSFPATSPKARLQVSADGGASWSKVLTVQDIRSLAADPRRPGTLYAGTPRGVSVSHDRGITWTRALREPSGIDTVVVDPSRPGTIWAGGYRLWRSQDAGRTWARMQRPNNPLGSGSSVRRIFLSPWDPETLYVIDFYLDGFTVPGSLWRSTDGGSTWEEIEGQDPVALAFDPVTPGLLYVGDRFLGLLRSRDGGTTWETVVGSVGGSRVTALLVDRLDPSILYAGTDYTGVWRSRDRGATWEPLSTGLIGPSITCLEAYVRNPRRLVACTQGGGLLEMRISSGS